MNKIVHLIQKSGRGLLPALGFALLLSLTGCEKDSFVEPPVTEDPDAIVFQFEIEGAEAVSKASTDLDFTSQWENGDAIGLYIVKKTAGATVAPSAASYAANVKLTYNSTTQKWTPETPLYFPAGKTGDYVVDFYAYYPYTAEMDPADPTFSILTNQSAKTGEKTNFSLSDLMWGATREVSRQTTPVTLTLAHKLSIVELEIESPSRGVGPSDETAVALLRHMPTAAFDFSTGTVTEARDEPLNIGMHRVQAVDGPDYWTKYTYRAIVPPQTITAGSKLFRIVHEGREMFFSEMLAADATTTSGRADRYKITLPLIFHTAPVEPGTFMMGSPDYEPNHFSIMEDPYHSVQLTQPFRMMKYEVTNALYAMFLNEVGVGSDGKYTTRDYGLRTLVRTSEGAGAEAIGLRYAGGKWEPMPGYAQHPVVFVSWYGANEFSIWAGGSLPTEAQWEYACRAGNSYPFGFSQYDGKNLDHTMAAFKSDRPYAWDQGGSYDDNTQSPLTETKSVGSYAPNQWGIYDMHGNVGEYVFDYLITYPSTPQVDPVQATPGFNPPAKVVRGGSYQMVAASCRSASRTWLEATDEQGTGSIGFRIVFDR